MVTNGPAPPKGVRVKVGKIASIDRGWLPITVGFVANPSEVGKIASIDRGWLRCRLPVPVDRTASGKNSLD